VQVQGVLSAAAEQWPHIHISDSLVMADAAVKMAQEGCSTIAVLGVDFMSENVRAILDEAGLSHVQVGAEHTTRAARAACLDGGWCE
jgi:quinolinate synthase